MDAPYDGYLHDCVDATVHHELIRDVRGDYLITLDVGMLGGSDPGIRIATLTPDMARRIATTLLCDVSLAQDGHG